MLSTGITAYAATYRASDITYTNSRSVANALDDLYSKTTELNTIKTNINQTNATASDILSGKTAYTGNGLTTGLYTPPTTMKGTEWDYGTIQTTGGVSKEIPIGFEVKRLVIYDEGNWIMVYDKDYSTTVVQFYGPSGFSTRGIGDTTITGARLDSAGTTNNVYTASDKNLKWIAYK